MLECLHRLVFDDAACREAIEQGLRRAAERFSDPQYQKSYSSVELPIEMFNEKLPEALRDKVRLCRAFTIKAGQRAPHEEIHRNSIQRLVSFRGSGTVNCAQPGGVDRTFLPRQIASPDLVDSADISACWDVVPANTWHYPEARGEEPWCGVAFHSASAEAIEDEYIPCSK